MKTASSPPRPVGSALPLARSTAAAPAGRVAVIELPGTGVDRVAAPVDPAEMAWSAVPSTISAQCHLGRPGHRCGAQDPGYRVSIAAATTTGNRYLGS